MNYDWLVKAGAIFAILLSMFNCIYAQQYFLNRNTLSSTNCSNQIDAPWVAMTSLSSSNSVRTENYSLGFPFNFFGVPYTSVNISPFGSFHFNRYESFCCTYSVSSSPACFIVYGTACSVSNHYENILAPFFTQLEPASKTGTNANIYQASAVTKGRFYVKFVQIPIYGAAFTQSFCLTLDSSSSITIEYTNVNVNVSPNPLLVGARMMLGADPWTANMAAWNYTRNGVYFPLSWVATGQIVRMCSIGWISCISPVLVDVTGGKKVFVYVKGELGCLQDPEFNSKIQCQFGTGAGKQNKPAAINNVLGAIECVVPAWGSIGVQPVQITYTDADGSQVALTGISQPPPSSLSIEYVASNDARLKSYTTDADYIPGICTDCSGLTPAVCSKDCAGVLGGSAIVDSCGVCSGGNTSRVANANKNCMNTCFGTSYTASECTVSENG
jgi:hypothetical protein